MFSSHRIYGLWAVVVFWVVVCHRSESTFSRELWVSVSRRGRSIRSLMPGAFFQGEATGLLMSQTRVLVVLCLAFLKTPILEALLVSLHHHLFAIQQ